MDVLEAGIKDMQRRLEEDGENAGLIQSALQSHITPKSKTSRTLKGEMFLKYYGLHDLSTEFLL